MSWRIATTHRSTYRYSGPVVASYNELRLRPLETPSQTVVSATIDVAPGAFVQRYEDYWGSEVAAFDLHEPHDRLDVVGRSVVDTGLGRTPTERLGWDALRAPGVQDRHAELLASTTYAPLEAGLGALAREAAAGLGPRGAVEAVVGLVRRRMRYETGTTHVTTSALQAFEQASGVCQDFAHVTLVLLRHLGLPARYVSGYLHPTAGAAVGEAVSGASHAWVEVFLGTWEAFDPTAGEAVGERHVAVARGRDYADVAPIVGVYQGGDLASLVVEVALVRLA